MTISFKDRDDFKPDYTPEQMFKKGMMGGWYFRDIYSSVIKKDIKDAWKEFDFLKNIPKKNYCLDKYDTDINVYKIKCGTSLEYWESKGWIHAEDPYGWIQWYCRFYAGRRIPDDDRQIKRFNGIKSRFGKREPKGPRMKQTLLHWAIKS